MGIGKRMQRNAGESAAAESYDAEQTERNVMDETGEGGMQFTPHASVPTKHKNGDPGAHVTASNEWSLLGGKEKG